MSRWQRVLVVHAGALGDSVLIWPLLRALVGDGAAVTFAARHSHARLAARCIDPARIMPADADAPELVALWRGDGEPATERFDAVLTFLVDGSTLAGRDWLAAGARRWPGAEIVPVGSPGSASRAAMWERARVADLGAARARGNPGGPVVLHVGAGSPSKRWPLDRFIALGEALARVAGAPSRFIAGEAEVERFTVSERERFAAVGGRVLMDLDSLADELGAAALVIGNDSGPTHLGAQLGVATLALFGPTDPAVWSPVGPLVGVLRPATPGAIEAISVDAAVGAATQLLGVACAFDPDPGDDARSPRAGKPGSD